MVAVAVAASSLADRSWDGLRPPSTGTWSGVATLVGDPGYVAGALRADVRIGGKRVEAWARGSAARALRDRLSGEPVAQRPDRKSTRLNSSHGYISYAVFCLKKKKKKSRTSHYTPHLSSLYTYS